MENTLLLQCLAERVLVMDGAMGTMIQTYGPTESQYRGEEFANHPCEVLKGNNDLLSITQSAMIAAIHRAYLEAGADIISSNTFNANAISQEDYKMQDLVVRMNRQSATLAREVCNTWEKEHPGSHKFVAGSMGPTNKSASIASDASDPSARAVDFDTLEKAYYIQAGALLDGGVDILLVETIFDTLNAKAALAAIDRVLQERCLQGFPVMLSVSVSDAGGRLLSGQSIEAFWASVSHFPLLSVGLNCSFGADKMAPYIEELSGMVSCFTSAYPNAGLPDMYGKYSQSPEMMAQKVKVFLDNGWVNFIGGCCGTTPPHIAAMAEVAKGMKPRRRPAPKMEVRFSGWEALRQSKSASFLLIGERTNVAGSRKFARLIREGHFDEALQIAREMVETGAHIIDVNMDDPLLNAPEAMRHFLLLMGSEPDIAALPVMIDSSQWEVVEAALKVLQGKSIINSISLKEGEEAFLKKARYIRRYGAAVVVMAFDEQGQATTYSRKVEICRRAYHLLTTQAGFSPENIIFDPNVLTIATGMSEHNRFALDFIDAVRTIKQDLPGALVSGGVSNLSFAFRGNDSLREAMHSVFLYHCIEAGMDMAIVKPGAQPSYDSLDPELRDAIEDVIFDRNSEAVARLTEIAGRSTTSASVQSHKTEAWREAPVEERIASALLLGQSQYLKQDLDEINSTYPSALSIIEGPLMKGMGKVGELFGRGKLFLPQVVKAARVMKQAVSLLQDRMSRENAAQDATDLITGVFATVKGDVHDIGKNLTAVVMECNHYNIVDLGVMIPAADIVEAVKTHNARFLCLSGLITPSLEEMCRVARAMEEAGIKIPILIGGATTSDEYTALRIAPLYSGIVIRCADASQNVGLLNSYFGLQKEAFCNEIRKEQEELRLNAEAKLVGSKCLSLKEARANRFVPEAYWKDIPCDCGHSHRRALFVPPFTGIREFTIPYTQLIPLINWEGFFNFWDSRKGKAPEEMRNRLKTEAISLLDRIQEGSAKAIAGFFPANSTQEDEIVLYNPNSGKEILSLPQVRNTEIQTSGKPNYSLADFIAPQSEKVTDHLGLFILRASGDVSDALDNELKATGAIDEGFLLESLLDALAEAASQWLHRYLCPSADGRAQGIRPAFGYPICPDHSQKQAIFQLMEAGERLGMKLTESYMLQPVCSVCGMYFAHPQAVYFSMPKKS